MGERCTMIEYCKASVKNRVNNVHPDSTHAQAILNTTFLFEQYIRKLSQC